MSILVICVDYACADDASQLARSIVEDPSSAARVLVVDNNASRSVYPGLKGDGRVAIHWPGRNLGYFGGARAGLERWLADHALPDWVLVSNCDLRFEPGFFDQLSHLSLSSNAGVVAPSIRSGVDARDQNPYRLSRPSRATIWKWRALYLHPLVYQLVGSKRDQAPRRHAAPPGAHIYAPHGSCIVLHRRYFERGGTLLHPGFLYMEEFFIGETARRLGLEVVYRPELRVHHREHETTGKLNAVQIVRWHRESLRGLLPSLSEP